MKWILTMQTPCIDVEKCRWPFRPPQLHCEMIKNWIEHETHAFCSLPLFLSFSLSLRLSTVRHDNYSNDWMEIVKSLRIHNKSNLIEPSDKHPKLSTMLKHVVQFSYTIDIAKNAFLCDNWIHSKWHIQSLIRIQFTSIHFGWIVISEVDAYIISLTQTNNLFVGVCLGDIIWIN